MQIAELKVIAGAGIGGPLRELAAQYEKSSGTKVTIFFGTTPELIKKITSGEAFDLGITPREVFEDAGVQARFAGGARTEIARVGLAVAVRSGARKPDISSPAALRQTLLEARSIATILESAAGAQILKLFERFGISDAMKGKIRSQAKPEHVGASMLKGEAELGVFLVNVLTVPGLDIVGLFPAEVQREVVYSAAVAAGSTAPETAKAFIMFMLTPEARALIKVKGLQPAMR